MSSENDFYMLLSKVGFLLGKYFPTVTFDDRDELLQVLEDNLGLDLTSFDSDAELIAEMEKITANLSAANPNGVSRASYNKSAGIPKTQEELDDAYNRAKVIP